VPESPAQRDCAFLAFECSWREAGPDVGWLRLAGELDIASTPELARTLRESQFQMQLVVLDLRELVFTDSCGVHEIVNAGIRAREAGRQLVVLRGPPNVHRMFSLTGSLDTVEFVEPGSLPAPGGEPRR
jgi:anti-anti-sigma factor